MLTIRHIGLAAIICLFVSACSPSTQELSEDAGLQADAIADVTDTHTIDMDTEDSDTAPDTSSDVQPGTDDPSSDEDEEDPDCHYDCFGEFECRDGQVYERPHAPIPCNEPDYEALVEQCIMGIPVGTCEQGCTTISNFRYDVFNDPWTIMCEEGRPRVVGDPCVTNDDCSPSLQTALASPESLPRPLVCDETTQRCVDPDYSDYLTWCDLDAVSPTSAEDPLYLAAAACAAEHCLLKSDSEGNPCQGCTLPCETTEDCPAGSYCVQLTELTTVNAPASLQRTARLCAPLELELRDCRTGT